MSKLSVVKVELATDAYYLSRPLNLSPASETLRFAASNFANFTPMLNVDCSLLIALISDISHTTDFESQPWFDRNIQQFVELEAEEELLLNHLFPAMSDRKLVCTIDAANKTREIARTLGTETEQERADLLFADLLKIPAGEARARMAALSDHTIPENWQIPITVAQPDQVNPKDPRFPIEIADKVGSQLSPLNRSVFLFGWRNRCTTLTSNRSAARQIEIIVRESIQNEDSQEKSIVGPHIWVNMKARSLVGREKKAFEKGRGEKAFSESNRHVGVYDDV